MKLKPLSDRVIVVTGAGSGIGLVTARTAARAGARVLMIARFEDVPSGLVAVTVGGGGRARVLFSKAFPTLFEALAGRVAQAACSPSRRQPTPSNPK